MPPAATWSAIWPTCYDVAMITDARGIHAVDRDGGYRQGFTFELVPGPLAAKDPYWYARITRFGRVWAHSELRALPELWRGVLDGKGLAISESGECQALYLIPEGETIEIVGDGETGEELFRGRFRMVDYRELVTRLG